MDVYVINLDRQTARRAWMDEILAGAGVDFGWLRAVDGYRLSQAAIDRRTLGNELRLSRFDVGLIMSHRKAWRGLLRSAAPHCTVLEDDIHVGRGFADLLAAVDEGRVEFDILRLETMRARVMIDRGRAQRLGGRDLCPLRSSDTGTAGYVINRRAAATLLQVTRGMAVPIDHFLFADHYRAANGLLVLQTVPAIVAQEQFIGRTGVASRLPSAMPQRGAGPKVAKPGPPRRLMREAARPLRQLAAAAARFRWMRRERGLEWGRIGFE